jgi:tetratricopeptide (TPR) repeat protein
VSVVYYIVAALLFSEAPTATPPSAGSAEQTRASADEPVNDDLTIYYREMSANRFKQALDAAERLDPGANNRRGTAIVAVLRASAMFGLKRDNDARKLIDKAEKLAPQEPDVLSALFYTSILADRYDVAADAFDKMIARAPDQAREQDRELVWHFLRNEPKDDQVRNDDRKVALARIGYGGDVGYGDYLAKEAVEILAGRNDFAGASELIRYIDDPQLIENLLIQRRYEPLWPAIEGLAGTRLEKVRLSSVRAAEQALAAASDDNEKLQMLANALRHAGRLDEVIALRSKLPATREAMSQADEHIGWVVNEIALALHEAGRADEADQLFAMLNDADIKDGHWLVSMKINRLELLVSDGKFDKALPLVEPTARAKGSPYAEQLVRRLRYCTLSGLGRQGEAALLLPELLAHATDAPGPTIDGLICAGQLDQAEKLALASLKEDKFHSDFVRSLQARPLTSDDPSVWQKGWKELRDRPAIAAEFKRLGRDMPEHLLPPVPTAQTAIVK